MIMVACSPEQSVSVLPYDGMVDPAEPPSAFSRFYKRAVRKARNYLREQKSNIRIEGDQREA